MMEYFISPKEAELLAEAKKRKEAEGLRIKKREENRIILEKLIKNPPPLPTGQY